MCISELMVVGPGCELLSVQFCEEYEYKQAQLDQSIAAFVAAEKEAICYYKTEIILKSVI